MKILIIDDDSAMTELLRLLFQGRASLVLVANSGPDGVVMTREQSPDVVILDLLMPEMDGWEVCSQIRKFSNLPILIMSALDNPAMIARSLDAGADDFLTKPVPNGVLFAHINNLVRRYQQPGKTKVALEVG